MKALVLLQRPPCQRLRPQARFEVNRRKAAALRPRWLAAAQAADWGIPQKRRGRGKPQPRETALAGPCPTVAAAKERGRVY